MKPEDIDNNAQRLYFSYPGSYFAKDDHFEKELLGSSFIGRMIFLIVDFFTCGAETKKVHDLAYRTLQAMQEQMKTEWPRWHCNGDERFGMYPGCPVFGATYQEVAQNILDKNPLGKQEDIKKEANLIIKNFNELPLFTKFSTHLTREHIINQAIHFEVDPNKPSVCKEEIDMLIKGKKHNPQFEDIFSKTQSNSILS